jgi:hypothetical protein
MTQQAGLPCPKCGHANPKGAWACGNCTERLPRAQDPEDALGAPVAGPSVQAKRVPLGLAIVGIVCVVLLAITLPFGVSTLMAWISGDLYFGKDPDGADKVLGIGLFLALPIAFIASISLIRTVRACLAHLRSQ